MTLARTVIALAIIAVPVGVAAQARYEGAGATQEMDCEGGTATIAGASNTMTITGSCRALVIEGAGNRVRVDLASKGSIRISGASNQVVWRTPDGSKTRVSVAGAGNRVSQSR